MIEINLIRGGYGIMSKCPCENCLIIPICRHKDLDKLLKCEPLSIYLMRYIASIAASKERIKLRQGVIDIVKPTQWGIDHNGYFTKYDPNKKRFIHYG